MEAEEFKYILEDLKAELQETPSIESLLKSTEKTTKKLECMNLYAQNQKRTFDLQIEDSSIMGEVKQLYEDITEFSQSYDKQFEEQIQQRLEETKEKYISTFDLLARQEEALTKELQAVENSVNKKEEQNQMVQIKEMDEYEDEPFEDDPDPESDKTFHNFNRQMKADLEQGSSLGVLQSNETFSSKRVSELKKEIEQLQKSISKINYGKGKWFDTDHKDFVKVFNKFSGHDKKVINECIKVLGMNQAEIMDHLQIYHQYLQFEKQKKLASEEYRQIKFMDEEVRRQQQQNAKEAQKLKAKQREQRQREQRQRKKQEVQIYRQKKELQKRQMLEKEEELSKQKLPQTVKPEKRNQILERNKKFIVEAQKKKSEKLIESASEKVRGQSRKINQSKTKGQSQIKSNNANITKENLKSKK